MVLEKYFSSWEFWQLCHPHCQLTWSLKATRKPRVWVTTPDLVSVRGLCTHQNHADLSGLCGQLTICCLGLSCCQGSYLSLCPYSSQALNWCPWLLLPLRASWLPRIWSITRDYVDFWWPCCCLDHTDLDDLHDYRVHGAFWAQAAAYGHIWVHGPASSGVCVDVCGLGGVVIGTMGDEIRGLFWAGPTLPCPRKTGPIPWWILQ